MADFRRYVTVLAVLTLFLGLAQTVNAQASQPLSCFASAAGTPTVRSEGITELVGDIVLNCTGGIPTPTGTAIPVVNIQVFLNTNITSRLIGGPAGGDGSEALLLVDEPGNANPNNPAGAQLVCDTGGGICSMVGAATPGLQTYNGTTGRPNIFQGRKAQGRDDSVIFLGVPIDPPGTNNTRIIRITNLRANASGVGASAIGPSQILAFISTNPGPVLPINNAQQIVAFVQRGLEFRLRSFCDPAGSGADPRGFQQCVNARQTNSSGWVASIEFRELFPTAFKTRPGGVVVQNLPGQFLNTNTESGFANQNGFPGTSGALSGVLASAGVADAGTRVKAVFNNVPTGMRLWVSITNIKLGQQGGNNALLVSTESGPFVFVPPQSDLLNNCVFPGGEAVAELAVTNNTAAAVWEIVGANASLSGDVDFHVFARFDANAAAGTPALGRGTVVGSFAPISTRTTAGGFEHPIPRFVGPGISRTLFEIFACRTNLLFPFVTNQVGFDTGLAISNTSTDPFGTTPQDGKCTLYSYGDKLKGPIDTPSIKSGTVYTTLASDPKVLPGFQGYVIAICQFQYAHGFALLSDFGARNFIMGYLALIIPDTPTADPVRQARPFPWTLGFTGEQLGY